MSRSLCLAIVGPTATGKTALAVEIARKLNGEIVCMDSTTIYREFDIGSAKPTAQERSAVPHHLVDCLDPLEPFSAGHFVGLANEILQDICRRGKLSVVVGGTYFYLRALQHGMYPTPPIPYEMIEQVEKEFLEEEGPSVRLHEALEALDPRAAQAIHPNDRYRLVRALAILRTTGQKPSELKPPPLPPEHRTRLWLKYAIALSRHQMSQNIVSRTDKMLAAGLVEETRRLKERYPAARALASIGYAEAVGFLEKRLTEKQLRNEIIEKTRQLAKRQLTWLRSDPEVRYVDHRDLDRVELEVKNLQFVLGGQTSCVQ